MANYNPNEYAWQTQNQNSQSYSFDTSNAFVDQAQTLGKPLDLFRCYFPLFY